MAQKFRKCILHIGTEKTGTTTLQATLANNKEVLLTRGVFVPMSLSPFKKQANHQKLTTCALNPGKLNDDVRLSLGIKTASDVQRHREETWLALNQEIDGIGRSLHCTCMVLSNEHCHSRIIRDDELTFLRDFLLPLVEEVKIVVYLRPQHEVALSLYSTAIKVGYHDIEIFPSFTPNRVAWVTRDYFNYASLLRRWSDCFGKDNVVARIYNKDVVSDFAAIIDVELKPIESQNLSLSAAGLVTLGAINRLRKGNGALVLESDRTAIVSALQTRVQGRPLLPARSDAVEFFQSFTNSNSEVRNLYFPHLQRLFSPDFSVYPETVPDLDEITSLIEVITSLSRT